MNLFESVNQLNGWYWQDDVWRVILQYLGGICPKFHLERGLNQLSNSGNLWEAFTQTACEYVAVAGRQICEEKEKLGTGRSIRKEEFLSHYVNFEDPPLELLQSAWQENCLGDANPLPKRVIWYFDIEYYNNSDSTIALMDQELVFQALEPMYKVVRKSLLQLGIDHIVISTGRGYNFVSSVSSDSPVFGELLAIGRAIESSVSGKQNTRAYKRTKQVSWQAEQSFNGAMRLVQFFAGLIINDARRRSPLQVEMTDQGHEGISFDLSFMTRSVDTSCFGIPATLYLKLHYQKHLNHSVVFNTPIFLRLIRASGSHDNFPDFRQMIRVRSNYDDALNHFAGQEGYIPDGSAGFANLIKLYWQSPMAYFHAQMDSEEHEPYWEWWRTYNNLDGIASSLPHLAHIIYNPNPALLQPDNLNYLINGFLDAGWTPKHIGGYIRAQYENPSINWGSRFGKYDAAKWANGWVEILGSQRYFGLN